MGVGVGVGPVDGILQQLVKEKDARVGRACQKLVPLNDSSDFCDSVLPPASSACYDGITTSRIFNKVRTEPYRIASAI